MTHGCLTHTQNQICSHQSQWPIKSAITAFFTAYSLSFTCLQTRSPLKSNPPKYQSLCSIMIYLRAALCDVWGYYMHAKISIFALRILACVDLISFLWIARFLLSLADIASSGQPWLYPPEPK